MIKLEPEFWRKKTLPEMSEHEWEALCDGCAKCCLHKLEDEDSGDVVFTCIACQLLDTETCRCRAYSERKAIVPDCVILKPDDLSTLTWMPSTCAYRLLYEGKALAPWHPLVSGRTESVHDAQVSVRNKVVSELDLVEADDWEDFIVEDL